MSEARHTAGVVAVVLATLTAGCGDKVTHCYVQAGQYGGVMLRGNVNNDIDRWYSTFTTVAEAVAAAKEIGCEVKP